MSTPAEIQAEISQLKEQLTVARTAYTQSLTNADVQSYFFDSGEGKQSATRRKPKEIRDEIEALERQIAQLEQRLRPGGGILSMRLRRS